MDPVPPEPQPVTARDSVSVYRQLAFNFVVDGAWRNVSPAFMPFDGGYEIGNFAIQFVPFYRISPACDDYVQERFFRPLRAWDEGSTRSVAMEFALLD